jgi:translation initiation factor IF-2
VAKVRVHELAKKYDVPSKDVLSMLSDLGEFVKAPSSTVEPPVVKRFEDKYGADLATKAEEKAAKKAAKKAPAKKAAAAKKAPAKKTAAKKKAS